MTTYYARVDYNYTTGDAVFSIPFSYIDKTHIKVYVNDTETDNFTFTTTSQITVSDTLTNGDTVSVRRTTPIDARMVTYSNTSILNKEVQNLAIQQIFNSMQEVDDNKSYQNAQIDRAVETANGAVATANTAYSKAVAIENVGDYIAERANFARQQAEVAKIAANSAITELRWIPLDYYGWVYNGENYTYTISNCPSSVGIYKNDNGDKKLVFNVNVCIKSDNTLILEAPLPFQGWLLTSVNF